jgi:arsenate reductase-like glutaredoxin family protein
MLKKLPLIALLLFTFISKAQDRPIKITDEQKANRLFIYATNENEKDLDVMITITGTGFRQSKAKPRLTRIPATSKVNIKSLIIERGKTPNYEYELVVNDSLSRRALKRPFELVKIEAKRPILIYLTDNCTTCDSLVASLEESIYLFKTQPLSEQPKMKEYLEKSLEKSATPLASLTTPILNLGGKIFVDIETYEQLMDKLKEIE